MLNKTNLLTAKIARDVTNRYDLSNIKITPTETIATDGHLLIRVTRPKDGEGEFLLNGEAALKIADSIDENDWLATEVKDGKVTLITGGEDSQHAYTQKLIDGKFPDYESVMPEGKPLAEVLVNVDYLITLLEMISKAQNSIAPAVLLSIYGTDKQIRLDARIPYSDQKICALVMPMQELGEETKRDYPVKAKTAKNTD